MYSLLCIKRKNYTVNCNYTADGTGFDLNVYLLRCIYILGGGLGGCSNKEVIISLLQQWARCWTVWLPPEWSRDYYYLVFISTKKHGATAITTGFAEHWEIQSWFLILNNYRFSLGLPLFLFQFLCLELCGGHLSLLLVTRALTYFSRLGKFQSDRFWWKKALPMGAKNITHPLQPWGVSMGAPGKCLWKKTPLQRENAANTPLAAVTHRSLCFIPKPWESCSQEQELDHRGILTHPGSF